MTDRSIVRAGWPVCLAAVIVFVMAVNPFMRDWKGVANDIVWGMGVTAFIYLTLLKARLRFIYGHLGKALNVIGRYPEPVVLVLMAVFLYTTLTLSSVMFQHIPHVADSHAMFMHSKIMAQGQLCGKSHAHPEFFNFQNVINNGNYCSCVFPGHVMLLALGQMVGMPWLVDPLLGALTLLVIFFLAREYDGRATALIACVLALLSPAILIASSEYMSEPTELFFLTLFLYGYIASLNKNRYIYAILTGAAAGFAFITRVQSMVPFCLPVLIHAFWLLIRFPRLYAARLFAMLGASLPFVLFLLYYNHLVSGSYWITPYQVLDGGELSLYIQKFATLDAWKNIYDDLDRASMQIVLMHRTILGWAVTPFIFILLFFLMSPRPRYSGLMISCCISQCLALVFVYGMHGSVFEPRYLYESMGIYLIFIAAFLRRLAALLAQGHATWSPASCQGAIALMVVAFILSAHDYAFGQYDLYGHDYWEGNSDYYYYLRDNVITPSVVFMDDYGEYRLIFFNEPPDDKSPIIFALNLHEQNEVLANYYPNRAIYIVHGHTIERLC